MNRKYKGHRLQKDGTYESRKDVHDRLTLRFNMKVAGTTTLGLISLGAFCDMVSANPAMQTVVNSMMHNPYVAENIARIVDGSLAGAAGAAALWTAFSAARDGRKIRAVEGNKSLGENYRPPEVVATNNDSHDTMPEPENKLI